MGVIHTYAFPKQIFLKKVVQGFLNTVTMFFFVPGGFILQMIFNVENPCVFAVS